ncbi:hypothetical protein P0136_11910 [Lentisphaerota bacterium ZTH]|nr:hypothetical protein JYG24_10575 [Lentisphaerota bacterium]WET06062.1 hypothetical protein P0136_11910 [Lentisphaerota bacterium ZTH]
MEKYYVNVESDRHGMHKVHRAGCLFLEKRKDRIFLGYFNNSAQALEQSKDYYVKVDLGVCCCREYNSHNIFLVSNREEISYR